jgi:hypothetical protein
VALNKLTGKLRGIITSLKSSHPDVYEALKKYADDRGVNVTDIAGAAIASYLAGDPEGKAELEKAMERRRQSGDGVSNVKAAMDLFKEMCGAMGEMFRTMNEARAGMSMSSMLSDFKAVTNTITEMRKAGAEAGAGSIEDILAKAFLQRILGGVFENVPAGDVGKLRTGQGRVKQIEE